MSNKINPFINEAIDAIEVAGQEGGNYEYADNLCAQANAWAIRNECDIPFKGIGYSVCCYCKREGMDDEWSNNGDCPHCGCN